METGLLIDIGSTFTKAVLVDLKKITIIAKSQALTTAEDNIVTGLKKALIKLKGWQNARYKLACSSAAGGLKIVAIGLVPDLTAEAAKRAALGAGSRVLKTYCYELTTEDVEEILLLNTDIILLAGGTDGGNREVIIKNAETLADSSLNCPIIIAGNRSAVGEVKSRLSNKKTFYVTENVMPGLEELNIEPARKKIREIFLANIVKAKGLNRVKKIIDGVIMPTPAAVLKAASLLARGYRDIKGLGELIVIDIGGATTDVHSIAEGYPTDEKVTLRGLKEPYIKRTVEGDVGMRFNAPTLLNLVGKDNIIKQVYKITSENLELVRLKNYIEMLHNDVKYLPLTKVERAIDIILARNAARIATSRHVGSIKTVYTPLGPSSIQVGKDLTNIKTVIGTGGIIVNSDNPESILEGILYKNQHNPQLLAPVEPDFILDRKYILAVSGILADKEPGTSLQLLKKYIN